MGQLPRVGEDPTMEQGEARGSPEGAHGSVGKGDWIWLQQQVTPLWLFLSRGPLCSSLSLFPLLTPGARLGALSYSLLLRLLCGEAALMGSWASLPRGRDTQH